MKKKDLHNPSLIANKRENAAIFHQILSPNT